MNEFTPKNLDRAYFETLAAQIEDAGPCLFFIKGTEITEIVKGTEMAALTNANDVSASFDAQHLRMQLFPD